jgi:hypothetical protein
MKRGPIIKLSVDPEHYACSHMGARARMGLPPEGAGRPVGPPVRGACFQDRLPFRGLEYWKHWQFVIIIGRKL